MKIGTQMEERLFRALKATAAQEGKPLGEVLEEAAAEYIAQRGSRGRRAGLERLLGRSRKKIPDAAFRDILRADYYDQ